MNSLAQVIAKAVEEELLKTESKASLSLRLEALNGSVTQVFEKISRIEQLLGFSKRQRELSERLAQPEKSTPQIDSCAQPLPIIKPAPTLIKLRKDGKPKSTEHGNKRSNVLTSNDIQNLPYLRAVKVSDIPIADEAFREFVKDFVAELKKEYKVSKQEVCRVLTIFGTGHKGYNNFYSWLQGYPYACFGQGSVLSLKRYITNLVKKANGED